MAEHAGFEIGVKNPARFADLAPQNESNWRWHLVS